MYYDENNIKEHYQFLTILASKYNWNYNKLKIDIENEINNFKKLNAWIDPQNIIMIKIKKRKEELLERVHNKIKTCMLDTD